ncbi:hypothetical protein NL418_010340 [Escherichia coli]|nr:hypothetical protein [Escherichia coli]WCQ55382.1 hypothetical protein NL418_010340 [Escherichia coli]
MLHRSTSTRPEAPHVLRRLKEELTGEGAARQGNIIRRLQGVEASLRWLTEMTTSLATTNRDYPGKRQGQFTGR